MTSLDEQAVMAAYAAGDDRAFDSLFDAFAPRLLAFLRRGFADASIAEDLLQVTFQRVHASRASYRKGAPVRPWLFTIAARVRIDELRRRYRVPPMASDDELDRIEAAEMSAPTRDQDDRARLVREAVEALPESQRMVVHLHRFEGLTFAQIASILNVKEGAVRVRAFRAYEVLRARLRPLMQAEVEP
jgi:RNA polymerase sigma factor (sigma-70 family)